MHGDEHWHFGRLFDSARVVNLQKLGNRSDVCRPVPGAYTILLSLRRAVHRCIDGIPDEEFRKRRDSGYGVGRGPSLVSCLEHRPAPLLRTRSVFVCATLHFLRASGWPRGQQQDLVLGSASFLDEEWPLLTLVGADA